MHFFRQLSSLAAILAALTLSPPRADARFVLPQDIATEAPIKETLSKLLAVKSSKDAEPFFASLKSAADAGSADALFAVAYLYQTGIGVEASAEKSKEAYQQAASKGSAAAKNNLGLLRLGLGENPKDAVATIEGNTVVVELPTGQEPVAVRFGWSNFPVVNLWNKNGLPAVPFRTDSFKGITERE